MEYYEGREIAEVLMRAHKRLLEPGSWIRGELAVDGVGMAVDPSEPSACQWCLVGAVIAEAVKSDMPNSLPLGAVRDLLNKKDWGQGEGGISPTTWNDHKAYDRFQVLGLLRQAAKEVSA